MIKLCSKRCIKGPRLACSRTRLETGPILCWEEKTNSETSWNTLIISVSKLLLTALEEFHPQGMTPNTKNSSLEKSMPTGEKLLPTVLLAGRLASKKPCGSTIGKKRHGISSLKRLLIFKNNIASLEFILMTVKICLRYSSWILKSSCERTTTTTRSTQKKTL